jgi:hypothetical protein
MFSNYLRIAFRTLGKNKIYSFINIFGFAIGITCTLLILLWVQDELTWNQWQPRYNRIFRLAVRATYEGSTNIWFANPVPAKDALKEEHPGIVNTVITDWGGDHLLAVGDNAGRSGVKKKGLYASEAFLDVFQHPVVLGNRESALKDMRSIVLTESTAHELFGDRDPLDQIVRLDDREELKVTAVIGDVPSNSSDQFDFLLTWQLAELIPWVKGNKDSWQSYGNPIYIELSDPALEEEVEKKIFDLPARHGETDFPKEFMLHPMSKWHLNSNFENGEEVGGQIV